MELEDEQRQTCKQENGKDYFSHRLFMKFKLFLFSSRMVLGAENRNKGDACRLKRNRMRNAVGSYNMIQLFVKDHA